VHARLASVKGAVRLTSLCPPPPLAPPPPPAETLLIQSRVPGLSLSVDSPLFPQLTSFYLQYEQSVSKAYGDILQPPILSYYLFMSPLLMNPPVPILADPFLSKDNSSTILVVAFGGLSGDKAVQNFVKFLKSEAETLLSGLGLGDHLSVSLTGLSSFSMDIDDGLRHDAATMDSIVLPLALAILAAVVGSVPLMLLPLVTIPANLLGQFLIMYPVSLHLDVSPFVMILTLLPL
jgi:hypothetical protein